MKKNTTIFITQMTFGALLMFFVGSSYAVSVYQAYEGSVTRVFNDPTKNQINAGDSVTGTLTYSPSPAETNGLLTDWSFVSENFILKSNSTGFSYFEIDPGYWIFDLTGNIGGMIGSSDFDGSVWIMLDGDFSDYSSSAPPTLGGLVGSLGDEQLTFFVEGERGRPLFEIGISAENITVIPLPTGFILFLSSLVGLALPVWGGTHGTVDIHDLL